MSVATAGRTAPSRKEVTHERIVEAASRAIRRSGYDGTGVADIMKEAGLTHGGFYAHFESRDEMVAEAVKKGEGARALVRFYLSKEHLEAAETGCPMAALGSEMPRQSAAVRR